MTDQQAGQIIALLQSLDDKTPSLGDSSTLDELVDIKDLLKSAVNSIKNVKEVINNFKSQS